MLGLFEQGILVGGAAVIIAIVVTALVVEQWRYFQEYKIKRRVAARMEQLARLRQGWDHDRPWTQEGLQRLLDEVRKV